MALFDYAGMAQTANEMLAEFGQLGAVRCTGAPTGPAYDPTPGADVDHPALFVVTKFDNREIDGSRILSTDLKVIMAVDGLEITPADTDLLVKADGSTLTIVDVDPLRPAETTLVYYIQARR